jgi:hypothetical protein
MTPIYIVLLILGIGAVIAGLSYRKKQEKPNMYAFLAVGSAFTLVGVYGLFVH